MKITCGFVVFIVIEGLDGSGKTTQSKYLFDRLSEMGYNATIESEPTYGAIGKFIRKALSEKVKLDMMSLQLLFIADRNEHIKSISEEINNKVVICDRYYYSTIAYGEAVGVSRSYLESMNSIFPIPDKTFFLEIDPSNAIKRIDSGRHNKEIFEKLETLKRIKSSYDKFKSPEIERINAELPKEKLAEILLEKTVKLLKQLKIESGV